MRLHEIHLFFTSLFSSFSGAPFKVRFMLTSFVLLIPCFQGPFQDPDLSRNPLLVHIYFVVYLLPLKFSVSKSADMNHKTRPYRSHDTAEATWHWQLLSNRLSKENIKKKIRVICKEAKIEGLEVRMIVNR